jgi:hypothetical protein
LVLVENLKAEIRHVSSSAELVNQLKKRQFLELLLYESGALKNEATY